MRGGKNEVRAFPTGWKPTHPIPLCGRTRKSVGCACRKTGPGRTGEPDKKEEPKMKNVIQIRRPNGQLEAVDISAKFPFLTKANYEKMRRAGRRVLVPE